jgi:hypothetical protein
MAGKVSCSGIVLNQDRDDRGLPAQARSRPRKRSWCCYRNSMTSGGAKSLDHPRSLRADLREDLPTLLHERSEAFPRHRKNLAVGCTGHPCVKLCHIRFGKALRCESRERVIFRQKERKLRRDWIVDSQGARRRGIRAVKIYERLITRYERDAGFIFN